jgi:hypothetical protein
MLHARQAAPAEPQFTTLVRESGTQVVPAAPLMVQPSHVPPPPPPVAVPPPVPPPVPPAVPQVDDVGLQVLPAAAQSVQALPAEPQVVLLLLFGFLTQVPLLSQQPSQFWGPHFVCPQAGRKATRKPTMLPSASALMFILLLRTAGNVSSDRALR